MFELFFEWSLFEKTLLTDLKIFIGASALFLGFYLTLATLTHRLALKLSQGERFEAVNRQALRSGQISGEISLSFISILIFGLIAVLVWRGELHGLWNLSFDFSWPLFLVEAVALFFWNEIHFFISHRILHIPFMYRRVHHIHHRSHRPTSYAAFSFHWVEALILGSVMPTVLLISDFSIYGLLTLPVTSLTLNVLGHSNTRLVWPLKSWSFAFRHSLHHSKVVNNFGFALSIFDRLSGSNFKDEGAHGI